MVPRRLRLMNHSAARSRGLDLVAFSTSCVLRDTALVLRFLALPVSTTERESERRKEESSQTEEGAPACISSPAVGVIGSRMEEATRQRVTPTTLLLLALAVLAASVPAVFCVINPQDG